MQTEPNHELSKFRQDYELYEIGTFDDNKGVIDSYPPAHICNFAQLDWQEPPKHGGPGEAEINNYDHKSETLKAVNAKD